VRDALPARVVEGALIFAAVGASLLGRLVVASLHLVGVLKGRDGHGGRRASDHGDSAQESLEEHLGGLCWSLLVDCDDRHSSI